MAKRTMKKVLKKEEAEVQEEAATPKPERKVVERKGGLGVVYREIVEG